ncbi:MAG: hypothetical protein AAGM67_19505, partial [Bacteroidota bacterium]
SPEILSFSSCSIIRNKSGRTRPAIALYDVVNENKSSECSTFGENQLLPNDFDLLEALSKALKPCAFASQMLAVLVLPLLFRMIEQLENESISGEREAHSEIREVSSVARRKLAQDIKQRIRRMPKENYSRLLASSLLDPRFKDLAFARGNDQSLAKAYVFSTVREARERLSTEEEDLSAESSVEEEMEGQTSLLANFFNAGKGRKQAKSSVDQEFSIYKSLPLSDLDNACPLKWWRTITL